MGGITTLGQVELLFLIFFIFAPARWLQVPPKSKNRFFWFLGVSGTPKIKKWQKSQKFRFFGHLGLPPGHCGQKNEKFFLLRSFLQLPRLRLGPLKGFLSWHGALQGPSTRLVRCFRSYRDTRTLSGVQRSQYTVKNIWAPLLGSPDRERTYWPTGSEETSSKPLKQGRTCRSSWKTRISTLWKTWCQSWDRCLFSSRCL